MNSSNSAQQIAFYTLAGVAKAQVEREGVAGKWSDMPAELPAGKDAKLLVDFANWPDTPEAIAKFTRKYGPLFGRHQIDKDGNGASFQVDLDGWRKQQQTFRTEWQIYSESSQIPISERIVQTSPKEFFVLRASGFAYQTENLWRLLLLSLDSVRAEWLRICQRPDCTHPYFVTRDLKQKFCSDQCSAWNQRQWKLKWWAEHGDQWRKKRQRKRRNNPSRKVK